MVGFTAIFYQRNNPQFTEHSKGQFFMILRRYCTSMLQTFVSEAVVDVSDTTYTLFLNAFVYFRPDPT